MIHYLLIFQFEFKNYHLKLSFFSLILLLDNVFNKIPCYSNLFQANQIQDNYKYGYLPTIKYFYYRYWTYCKTTRNINQI